MKFLLHKTSPEAGHETLVIEDSVELESQLDFSRFLVSAGGTQVRNMAELMAITEEYRVMGKAEIEIYALPPMVGG